jgi:hypothetical protein
MQQILLVMSSRTLMNSSFRCLMGFMQTMEENTLVSKVKVFCAKHAVTSQSVM